MKLFNFRYPLAVLSVGLLACGSDDGVTTPPEPPPGDPVWSEITNLPSPITLYSLWSPRDDYAIGVGRAGRIWQWNGQRWIELNSPIAEDLFAIDGSVSGSVIAVGDHGTVLEQTQGSFTKITANTVEDLRGVWRSDSGLIVVVGSGGLVLRRVGVQWSADDTPTYASLLGVWGSSDTDIFAVGVGGVILHNDGSGWSIMPSGTTAFLTAISGNSPTDVYAVGTDGTILHYDGVSWSSMDSGTNVLLQSVCAECGPAAVGINGIVLRRSNNAWHRETIPGSPWLYAITNSGSSQWTVGAHALFRYDGAAWANLNRGTLPVLRSVAFSPTLGLVAAGENGVVFTGGPDNWRYEDAGALSRLNTVWVSPAGDVFAAGVNRIYRRTDEEWVTENSNLTEYFDIDGNNAHVFAVGANGIIRERIGNTWGGTRTIGDADFHAIHMTDTGGTVVGTDGTVVDFDGATWDVTYTRPNTVLWDVAPVETTNWDAVAVGDNGVCIGHSTAVSVGWETIPTPLSHSLYHLVRGPGNGLFALGAAGTMLRFTGEHWDVVPTTESRTYRQACAHGGAMFVCGGSAGSGGIVLRYGPPN